MVRTVKGIISKQEIALTRPTRDIVTEIISADLSVE